MKKIINSKDCWAGRQLIQQGLWYSIVDMAQRRISLRNHVTIRDFRNFEIWVTGIKHWKNNAIREQTNLMVLAISNMSMFSRLMRRCGN
jgi:hypothetical protein